MNIREAWARAMRRITVDESVNEYVGTPCWGWTGAKSEGYGIVSVDGRSTGLHRVSYTINVGPIPEGLFVLHKCNNPVCCRPDHLRVGTALDNAADMVASGRAARGQRCGAYTKPDRRPRGERHGMRLHPERRSFGERQGRSKLKEPDVREIRRLRAAGARHVDIARKFGVTPENVICIVQGKTWRHILP